MREASKLDMGLPESPTSKPYPRSVQLKLYHAFIFSVPILFTIILFLLFHLFYIKRRSRHLAISSPPPATTRLNPATLLFPPTKLSKEELREQLPAIIFNKDTSGTRENQCCVCLVDFQMEELLHQAPSCKHIFHIECIHGWLMTNASCPLCRAPVLPLKKTSSTMNENQIASLNHGSSNSQISTQNQAPVGISGHGIAIQETRIECSNSIETPIANEHNFNSTVQVSCDSHQVHLII